MILLLIAWHPFHKALFALTLIMTATPPYCTSTSPAYTTLSPLCSVLDPTHFHLVSLISNTSIPHPAISLAPCTVRVASAMVLTFQQPMVACFQGLLWAFQPLGFPPALAQERHYGPSSVTAGLSCVVNASSFCHMLEDQGITLCLVSTLRPVQYGWPYQGWKTPADISLGAIETRKLPHHDKVVTSLGAVWKLHIWIISRSECLI